MNTLANYLLQMSCWIAAFWVVYVLVLKKETYFGLNRWFLNTGLLFSTILPLFPFTYKVYRAVQETEVFVIVDSTEGLTEPVSKINYLLLAYLAGAVFFVVRFVTQHVQLYRIRKRSISQSIGSLKVFRIEKETAPFSFFNHIYVSSKTSNEVELNTIVAHEKVHIHERHWADLLLLEVVRTLQWFNPLMQLYRKAMMQNHEYLADSGTLERGVSARTYRAILANQMLGVPVVSFANSFTFFNSTNRILMMKKDKSTPVKRLKILLILPLISIIVMGFARPNYIYSEITDQTSKSTTAIKGRVIDENKKPVEGATVAILTMNGQVKSTINTDRDGNFSIDKANSQDMLIVSFEGAESYKVRIEDSMKDFKIQLKSKETVQVNTISVKGKILDEDGNPLPGASVIVSNSTVGTLSNMQGEFELRGIKPTDNLVVSFVGYETTVSPAKSNMTFKMDRSLVPIVVLTDVAPPPPPPPPVEINKEDEGEAFVVIKDDNGNNPLLIVDGEILKEDPSSLDPKTVDRIFVLKGEQAIESYGDKAKYGAILITTKKHAAETNTSQDGEVFVVVEDMPQYPGGAGALADYVHAEASKYKLNGVAYVDFTIDAKGQVTNIRNIRADNKKLIEPAQNIVAGMKDWKPGMQRGKPVKVDYNVKIEF